MQVRDTAGFDQQRGRRNVTQELPARKEVSDRGEPGLTYFRTATDAGPPGATDPEVKGFRPGLLPEASRAWGFAAAAFDSRDRVGQFEEVVGRYLGAGAEGGHLLQALREPPPAGAWEAARARFRRAEQAVQQALDTLERARSDLAELAQLRSGVADRARRRLAAEETLRQQSPKWAQRGTPSPGSKAPPLRPCFESMATIGDARPGGPGGCERGRAGTGRPSAGDSSS